MNYISRLMSRAIAFSFLSLPPPSLPSISELNEPNKWQTASITSRRAIQRTTT